MIDGRCVARGYVSGSDGKDYRKDGRSVACASAGLRESDRLREPILRLPRKPNRVTTETFPSKTAVKADCDSLHIKVRDLTLKIMVRASGFTQRRGASNADTKFEFGFAGDQLVLADEVLTRIRRGSGREPVISRRLQPSFDKQYVRDSWSPSTGTSNRRRPRYQQTSFSAPARSIGRRIVS